MSDKYEWMAYYTDGSVLDQAEYLDDISKQPGCESRSAFYDVDHSKLHAFEITNGQHVYCVELSSGTFMVDGVPFRMHSLDEGLTEISLIWHKRSWHHSNGSPSQTAYRLGWSAKNSRGERVQQVMEID